jgi:hypothetical protein
MTWTSDELLELLKGAIPHYAKALLRCGGALKAIAGTVSKLPVTTETYEAIGIIAEHTYDELHKMHYLHGDAWQPGVWSSIYISQVCSDLRWALDDRIDEDDRERHATLAVQAMEKAINAAQGGQI